MQMDQAVATPYLALLHLPVVAGGLVLGKEMEGVEVLVVGQEALNRQQLAAQVTHHPQVLLREIVVETGR